LSNGTVKNTFKHLKIDFLIGQESSKQIDKLEIPLLQLLKALVAVL